LEPNQSFMRGMPESRYCMNEHPKYGRCLLIKGHQGVHKAKDSRGSEWPQHWRCKQYPKPRTENGTIYGPCIEPEGHEDAHKDVTGLAWLNDKFTCGACGAK